MAGGCHVTKPFGHFATHYAESTGRPYLIFVAGNAHESCIEKSLQKLFKSDNAEVPFQLASDVSIKADHKRPVPKLHDGPLVDSIRLLLGKCQIH